MTGAQFDLARVYNLSEFEALACQRLPQPAFDYIAGGAGDELTLADNVAAWRRWRLRPRVLVDVSQIEIATSLLGSSVRLPVGLAPVAFQEFAHPDAELGSARAAAAVDALYCLSTLSSRSLEDVAAAADAAGSGPRWFQLYVHRHRDRARDLVARAEAAGYSALILTADIPVAGLRERDARNRLPYPQVYGNFSLAEQPDAEVLLPVVTGGLNDASLNWEDLAWLRSASRLPLVLKGVLTSEDARLAVEHGAAAVWVSNHGGRQLDRAPATAAVLGEVVQAVAGQAEVYVDGGIRRATDVLTALCLGARAVFVGRPMIYALACGGEAGVVHALDLLARELITDMALLGAGRLDQLGPERLLRS